MIEIIQGDNIFPTWRYTLTSKNDGQEIVLKHLPDGWQENGTEWRREARGGFGRKLVIQLRFVKEGADYLRTQMRDFGVSAQVHLKIEKFSEQKYRWENWFLCQIKFEDCKDVNQPGFSYFECSLVEMGIKQSITAQDGNTFELELDKEIFVPRVANAEEQITYKSTKIKSQSWANGGRRYYPILEIQDDTAIVSPKVAFLDIVEPADPFLKKGKEDALQIDFKGKMVIKMSEYKEVTSGPSYDPEKEVTLTVRVESIPDEDGNKIEVASQQFKIKFIYNRSVISNNLYTHYYKPEPEEYTAELDLLCKFKTIDSWRFVVDSDKNKQNVLVDSLLCEFGSKFMGLPITNQYSFKAISAFDLCDKLLHKMHTGSDFVFKSDILKKGAAKDIYFTSGDAVRGYENAVIKVKYKDVWDTLDRLFFIADFYKKPDKNGVEEYRIESKDLAFNKDVEILDLGAVNDMECTPLKSMLCNVVKTGSPDKEYDAVNGRYEYNTEYEFHIEDRKITPQTLNLVTPYRTDSFGIHHARYQSANSTDKKSDNDVFVVHAVNQDFTYNDIPRYGLAPYWVVAEGDSVQKEQLGAFNYYLSPKRCMNRWARFLAGVLYQTSGILKFESIAKSDAKLSSILIDYEEIESVVEQFDFDIMDIENRTPLYYPQEVKIYATIPQNISELMSNSNNGYISFTYQGKKYKGFLIEVEDYKSSESDQEIIVYMHPETPWDYPKKTNNFITL